MVYGHTPFAHIRNLQQRMLAIQNPMHQIDFPSHAVPRVNGVEQPDLATRVETDLIKVMKGCLRFEPRQRLSIPELLEDPFLRRENAVVQSGASGSLPRLISQTIRRSCRRT